MAKQAGLPRVSEKGTVVSVAKSKQEIRPELLSEICFATLGKGNSIKISFSLRKHLNRDEPSLKHNLFEASVSRFTEEKQHFELDKKAFDLNV